MSKIPVPQQWNAKLDQPITPAAQQFLNAVADNSGGGGAPTDAEYILSAPDAELPNALVLTAGTNITLTPGPGTLTVDARGGGGGGVTSVDLSMPAEFSVAGGPITSSGTLAVTKATQSANQFYAGPISGAAAAPAFRALNVADFGGLGLALLQKTVLGTAAATISFPSIPQTFSDLIIAFCGRDTSTSFSDASAWLQMNGDNNTAHYTTTEYILGSGTNPAGSGLINPSTSGGSIVYSPGLSSFLSAVGYGEIIIPNYAGTAFQKMALSTSIESHGNTGKNTATRGFGYLGTTLSPTGPITDLLLTCFGTAFAAGTTAVLYGRG